MNSREVVRGICFAMLLLFAGMPAAVTAQEIEIGPPPVPPRLTPMAWHNEVSVTEHSVQVSIDGPIADVTIRQVFENQGSGLAEGVFLFPLPKDAAVGDFQMTVNGQVLEGQVMDSDEARGIYEATVRELRDPALLEYAGQGLYRTSVFPIPAGESRTLQFRYGVLLESVEGLSHFHYPLRIPGASRPAQRTELNIDLRSDTGLRAIYSPSHNVDVQRVDEVQAIVRFVVEGERLDSDFELYFGSSDEAIALNLISHKPAMEDGYFIMLATPAIAVQQDKVAKRDIVFVLDSSGSMAGPKIEQAKDAVQYVVEHLNPQDHFNLLAFSTGVQLWEGGLQPASEENLERALAWVNSLEAGGSTDINRALLEALGQISLSGSTAADTSTVLFMTDGLPTMGETEPARIVQNAMNNQPLDTAVRLFTFGVGFDVNTDLLDVVSSQLGGRSRYVRPDQQIDEAISSFYATIQTPVLTNVEVDFGEGPVVSDTFPFPLPDLFAGEQLVLTGRYRNGGEVSVTLSGTVDGERVSFVYLERTLVQSGGDPFVARLWATRNIGEMMQQIRIHGPEPELIDAVVDLSMRFGIVTPYTSYLVEEPSKQLMGRNMDGRGGGPSATAPALEFDQAARASVAAEAAQAYAAPASGEAAVDASAAREQLRSATSVTEHGEVRYAGGRTFVSRGIVTLPDASEETLWVDTNLEDEMAIETVEFASERYFELSADDELAPILALSSELLFVLDDKHAIRITSLKDELSTGVGPIEAPEEVGDTSRSDSSWQRFWDRLTGD